MKFIFFSGVNFLIFFIPPRHVLLWSVFNFHQCFTSVNFAITSFVGGCWSLPSRVFPANGLGVPGAGCPAPFSKCLGQACRQDPHPSELFLGVLHELSSQRQGAGGPVGGEGVCSPLFCPVTSA